MYTTIIVCTFTFYIKGSDNVIRFFLNVTGSTYNVAHIFIKGVTVF